MPSAMDDLLRLNEPELQAEHVARWHGEGKKIIGWLCAYVPEELIIAANMVPVRIAGVFKEQTPLADTYVPSASCSFCRAALEGALAGDYAYLDGVVAANGCLSMVRLMDNWRFYAGTPFAYMVDVPHTDAPTSRMAFRRQLLRMKAELEGLAGITITDAALREAIALCNTTRRLLTQLYDTRKAKRPPVTGLEALSIVKAAAGSDRAQVNLSLERLLGEIEQGRRGPLSDGPRVLIGGGEIHDLEFVRVIEKECGAQVVVDYLCTGVRYFAGLVREEGDPIDALAERYLKRQPCARMCMSHRRAEEMLELARDYSVDGILYMPIKFCDPILYEYPLMEKLLTEGGMQVLRVDRDHSLSGPGQIRTRVEAFVEMLV